MTFQAAKQDELNLNEYISLEREKAKIVATTQAWMNRATALHGLVDSEKQTEIVVLRNALKSELATALGL